METLAEGLGSPFASQRAAAAAAAVALICRLLRRLSIEQQAAGAPAAAPWAAAGASAPPAATAAAEKSLDTALLQRQRDRDLRLLHHLLQQLLLLPVCLGSPSRRQGGLIVLRAVLPLGFRSSACGRTQGLLEETAERVFFGLLRALPKPVQDTDAADTHTSSSNSCCYTNCSSSCCCCGSDLFELEERGDLRDPREALEVQQCLQAITVTGQCLLQTHRAVCLDNGDAEGDTAADAAADAATAATTPAAEGRHGNLKQAAAIQAERRHRVLLQGQRMMEHLRPFALSVTFPPQTQQNPHSSSLNPDT